MKTITKNGASVYLFSDEREVTTTANGTEVKEAAEGDTLGKLNAFTISDCRADDAALYENVEAPENWQGGKFLFDGATWTLKE